jgi:hypothetical protein
MGNLAANPNNMTTPYKHFFVAYNNGTTWVCKAGHCYDQLIWDFRNESARDYYVNTVVGSSDYGIGNPLVQGMFFDDIAGLGTELPGLVSYRPTPPPHTHTCRIALFSLIFWFGNHATTHQNMPPLAPDCAIVTHV